MHVAVVGGGIGGLTAAWALAKRGARVTLVEQGPIPHPLSASGDEHRIIRRAYGALGGYQRRIGEAYAAWDALWDDLGAKHLVDTGFILVSQAPGDEAEGFRDGLAAGGCAFDMLSAAEAAARWPFLDAAAMRWAAFSAEGGVLLCRPIAAGLRARLSAAGATLRENAAAVAVSPGRVAIAGGAAVEADHVLVAAGAWTPQLVPALAPKLSTMRNALAYLRPPADLAAAWAAAPVVLDVGGSVDGYAIPPVAGTGLKVGARAHMRAAAADEDRAPAPGEGEAVRGYMAPVFARLGDYAVERVVTCVYTFTADEHFLVEAGEGLTVLSACSGHGYKFGAAVGERLAEGLLAGDLRAAKAWIEARD